MRSCGLYTIASSPQRPAAQQHAVRTSKLIMQNGCCELIGTPAEIMRSLKRIFDAKQMIVGPRALKPALVQFAQWMPHANADDIGAPYKLGGVIVKEIEQELAQTVRVLPANIYKRCETRTTNAENRESKQYQ